MPGQPAPETRFARRVGLFSAGTLLSRILGVARESVFAALFGAGPVTDAFNVAFRVPNVLRDLFAESALSAAFVPAFVQSLRAGNPERTRRFAANVLNTLALVTGLLTVIGILFTPLPVRVIALGFAGNPEQLALTSVLTRIMFPLLFFVALAAWAMGILNANGSFFVPAVAPAAFNLLSAALPVATYGLFKARGIDPIHGMAWGVTLGAIAQFAVQVPALARHGFRWQPVIDFGSPELRQVFRRWLPMVLGYATWQINFLTNTFLLTFLREGSVTWVNYAYRIQHLPAGLFGAAIGSVALAEFAHGASEGGFGAIRERFRNSLGLVSVLTLPAAVLLIALAVPVTRLIYQHGRFTPQDTLLTAQALALYCCGIWSAAATRNVAAGFYSTGDTRTPALVAVGVVTANIAINLLLMRFIQFRSFPLAAALTQTANFIILFAILRRRAGGLDSGHALSVFLRSLAASGIAGALAFVAAALFERLVPPVGILRQLAQVALAGALGLAVFYAIARLFRLAEVEQALRAILRRSRNQAGTCRTENRV